MSNCLLSKNYNSNNTLTENWDCKILERSCRLNDIASELAETKYEFYSIVGLFKSNKCFCCWFFFFSKRDGEKKIQKRRSICTYRPYVHGMYLQFSLRFFPRHFFFSKAQVYYVCNLDDTSNNCIVCESCRRLRQQSLELYSKHQPSYLQTTRRHHALSHIIRQLELTWRLPQSPNYGSETFPAGFVLHLLRRGPSFNQAKRTRYCCTNIRQAFCELNNTFHGIVQRKNKHNNGSHRKLPFFFYTHFALSAAVVFIYRQNALCASFMGATSCNNEACKMHPGQHITYFCVSIVPLWSCVSGAARVQTQSYCFACSGRDSPNNSMFKVCLAPREAAYVPDEWLPSFERQGSFEMLRI